MLHDVADLPTIPPLSHAHDAAIAAHLDGLAHPRGSLGTLEDLAAHVCRVQNAPAPRRGGRRIVTFAADHGVVAEGVTCQPQSVTAEVVREMLAGKAAISALCRRADCEHLVVDVGLASELQDAPRLISRRIRAGTGNMAHEAAMSRAEAMAAIGVGIEQAQLAAVQGVSLLGCGEMGIGNTTAAAALYACLLDVHPDEVTGPGSGLSPQGVMHKALVIRRAIGFLRPKLSDPIDCLAKVGGLEIAAMAGCLLGAAAHGIVPIVDGFIASAAALVACRLRPELLDYLVWSHYSAERGHAILVEELDVEPLLDLNMRLGEGTGCATAMHLIEDGLAIWHEMVTWEDAGVQKPQG